MKHVALILVVYVSILSATPAICSSYTSLVQMNLCCTEMGCSDDSDCSDTKQADHSKNTPSCIPCCYIQTCYCHVVTIPQFNFKILPGRDAEKIPTENDKIYFTYLSDCWHPPKR